MQLKLRAQLALGGGMLEDRADTTVRVGGFVVYPEAGVVCNFGKLGISLLSGPQMLIHGERQKNGHLHEFGRTVSIRRGRGGKMKNAKTRFFALVSVCLLAILGGCSNFTDWTEDINPSTKTITFKANGGTGSDYTQTIDEGKTATLTTCTFTYSGYSFTGWSTSATGDVAYTDGARYTMGSSNVTLYAVWKVKSLHISAT